MVSLVDTSKAMLMHRRLEAAGLNAKRLTPQSGYASFCAVFALPKNDDTHVSPYFRQDISASKISII